MSRICWWVGNEVCTVNVINKVYHWNLCQEIHRFLITVNLFALLSELISTTNDEILEVWCSRLVLNYADCTTKCYCFQKQDNSCIKVEFIWESRRSVVRYGHMPLPWWRQTVPCETCSGERLIYGGTETVESCPYSWSLLSDSPGVFLRYIVTFCLRLNIWLLKLLNWCLLAFLHVINHN